MNFPVSRSVVATAAAPLALFLSSASPIVLAQSGTDDATLAPVVVTATRTSQTQPDTIAHTTVLSAEDIRRAGASDVPALLRREAGIQITRTGGLGSATGLFTRGADTRQTLVLIDGVPMTKQDATGTVSIDQIPLDQIDRIEIVRGNVSAIYGSGAVGGVIQIFTKTGTGPAQTNASAEVGARDTVRLAGGVRGSVGQTSYSLQLSALETDNFSAINPRQLPAANPDDDGYRNKSASGSVGYRFSKDHSLGARFLVSEGDSEYDSSFGTPADSHTQTIKNRLLSLYSKNRLGANWQSDLMLSRFDDKYSNVVPAFPTQTETETTQFQWNNTVQLGSAWTATAGYEHRRERYDNNANLNPSRTLNALHGGVLGEIDRHQLQANLRHDRYSDVGSATTGYLGYGFAITDTVKATASYATSFSAAPLGYLYSPGWGNPNLRPEEAKTAELGVQYDGAVGLLKAVLFRSRTDDQFAFRAGRFENVQEVENEGLELSYSGVIDEYELRASLTLQEPRDVRAGTRLVRRARTMGNIAVAREFGNWHAEVDTSYVGARPDQDSSAFPATPVTLDSYWLVNLNARYRFSKQVELFGRIENLFDEDYQTAFGYNQAPRGLFVGVNWRY